MWYHKKFKLQYDTNVFNEIIEYAERATWRQGYRSKWFTLEC